MIEITSGALRHAVETMGYGAAGLGFLAGLTFSFNPVTVAAIPVALAYVTRARERGDAVRLGAAFVAGMLATHVAFGLIAGAGGRWASELMGRSWWLLLGPLLIVLGLVWAGWLRIPLPTIARRTKRPSGAWAHSRSECHSAWRSARFAHQSCWSCSASLPPSARPGWARLCCWPSPSGARCRSCSEPGQLAGWNRCARSTLSGAFSIWPEGSCLSQRVSICSTPISC